MFLKLCIVQERNGKKSWIMLLENPRAKKCSCCWEMFMNKYLILLLRIYDQYDEEIVTGGNL